jgi:hypothetical protein|tara:strand:+ start:990 stop:1322 length:333 start_codon:yes stop_codon:yes gene_type:complete
MNYKLASGKELTIGRENHTGLLQFILDKEGGQLPKLLAGKFTSQKFVDEAYQQYRAKTSDSRTAHPLNEADTAFSGGKDGVVEAAPIAVKKERPVLKYKNPKKDTTKKDS